MRGLHIGQDIHDTGRAPGVLHLLGRLGFVFGNANIRGPPEVDAGGYIKFASETLRVGVVVLLNLCHQPNRIGAPLKHPVDVASRWRSHADVPADVASLAGRMLEHAAVRRSCPCIWPLWSGRDPS